MATENNMSHTGTTVLTPEAFCFILDRDNDTRLEFQLMPLNISESKGAVYNEIPILGRSLPLLGYAYSTSRTVGLSLQFAVLQQYGKYSAEWVIAQARWLESKVYPEYTSGLTYPPPRLALFAGQALSMDCVMTSVNTVWEGPWEIQGPKASAFRVQVDCTFQEYGMNNDRGHPFSHSQAVQGKNQLPGGGSGGSSYIEIPLGGDSSLVDATSGSNPYFP